MKAILVTADGRTIELDPPPYAQWMERSGTYFYGTETYNREKPYRGAMVYLEVPQEVYEARRYSKWRPPPWKQESE